MSEQQPLLPEKAPRKRRKTRSKEEQSTAPDSQQLHEKVAENPAGPPTLRQQLPRTNPRKAPRPPSAKEAMQISAQMHFPEDLLLQKLHKKKKDAANENTPSPAEQTPVTEQAHAPVQPLYTDAPAEQEYAYTQGLTTMNIQDQTHTQNPHQDQAYEQANGQEGQEFDSGEQMPPIQYIEPRVDEQQAPVAAEATMAEEYNPAPVQEQAAYGQTGEEWSAYAATTATGARNVAEENTPDESSQSPEDGNGRARIRIPWDENAVRELAYGEPAVARPATAQIYEQPKRETTAEEPYERPENTAFSATGFEAQPSESTPLSSGLSLEGPSSGSGGAGGGKGSSGSGGTPPGGGAWVWLPQGMEPRRSWPRRHPVLFWGGIVLILLLIFNAGRISTFDVAPKGPKIAVINVEGVIMDSTSIVKWIQQVAADDAYKGALVKINSPGGGVGPSQEIYAALKRLDKKKPVVASMGSIAASGGYYAALGAREIYAGPSTLTGSIGVKMQVPNVEGLMRTLGLSEKTLVSGAYKDAGSAWRQMLPEEEEYFYGILDDMYEEFVGAITLERKISMEAMEHVANGKAMTGRQAKLLKLVDTLGDQHDALQRLKELCGMEANASPVIVEGPKKKEDYLKELLLSMFSTLLEQKSAAEQPMFLY